MDTETKNLWLEVFALFAIIVFFALAYAYVKTEDKATVTDKIEQSCAQSWNETHDGGRSTRSEYMADCRKFLQEVEANR